MWIGLVVIIIFILLSGIIIFNRLVRYSFLMREATSGMDVQLKRRHDLIPNIVEAVKGYMQYERTLLEEVVRLRNKLTTTIDTKQKSELESSLSQSLKNIFALVENYPDLKANQSFLELQKSLVAIEDQIQLARRYYNGTVRDYNITVESFPGNIVANLFSFKTADFFEIEYATERQVPDLKFNT